MTGNTIEKFYVDAVEKIGHFEKAYRYKSACLCLVKALERAVTLTEYAQIKRKIVEYNIKAETERKMVEYIIKSETEFMRARNIKL